MTQKKMEITISPLNPETGFTKVSQVVKFINILEGAHIATKRPSPILYEDIDDSAVALWNYYFYVSPVSDSPPLEIGRENGLAPTGGGDALAVSVFRQEIGYDADGNAISLSPLVQVGKNIGSFSFKDYGVSNNRLYRYIIRPSIETLSLREIESVVKTTWDGWSLTELHPVDSSFKKFTVSPSDVWLFKYNVETGEQAQNMIINEQQTFGQYPKYSQGRLNYISGTVNCLLGSQITPASYLIKNGKIERERAGIEKN